MIANATTVRQRLSLPLGRRLPQIARLTGPLAAAATAESRLGMIPLLSLVGSLGLLLVAVADTAGRLVLPFGYLLFWIGYVLLVAPFAVRLLGRSASRPERITLLVILGLAMYVIKLLQSPGSFTLFDEFHHWKTLDDILLSGHLFAHNNILPASPFYPGLEITTDPLVGSGLSIWDAGVLVIAVARVIMVLALFLFMEEVSGSARVASVGTLVYMANPSFLFFDAQFAYESLALPLAVFVLYCILRRQHSGRDGTVPFTAAILLAIGAVVVTHHVTSILLAIFLSGWAVVTILVRIIPGPGRRRHAPDPHPNVHPDPPGPIGPALIAVTATIAWMLYWASVTVGYLAPAFGGAINEMVNLIAGEESSRVLFGAGAGGASPTWEQLTGYASVALLLASILVGGVILWRAGWRNAAAAALGITALAYPATLAARFTSLGAEIGARSAEFVFVGLGFLVAFATIWLVDHPRLRKRGMPVALSVVVVLFVGGVVVGLPYWGRLPGPFLVSADPRSVEPLGIDTATWMLDNLGPGNKLMTDRVDRVLSATYGQQHPISAVGDQIDVKAAYFAARLDINARRILRKAGVQYVLTDDRLPTSLPYTGVYVERGEIRNGAWTQPMSPVAISKWATIGSVNLIYDAGHLRIYDISALTNVAPAP